MVDFNSKEKPIRSVERAINVLQAINRHGAMTMTQISRAVKLPYPTTCRFVFSLIRAGVIEREPGRKFYRPTALAQSLSCGYQPSVRLVAIARKHIEKLTKETGWPVSLASRVGSVMVIQDSTHALTTLTFSDYHPGYTLPIISSASGLAYLAFTDEEERRTSLEQIRENVENKQEVEILENIQDSLFDIIRQDGYASAIRNQHTKDPGKTSSIAVPLFHKERIVGCLTLIFFSTSMRVADAYAKYKDAFIEAQTAINHDLEAMKLFDPERLENSQFLLPTD